MLKYRYIIFFILLLPLYLFRDYTPSNELKYLSIAEEALRSNTWFAFYNHGEIYADKPPLHLWLIMLSKLLTGGYHMIVIGLLSLLPALGILAVMDKWLREFKINHNPLVSNLLLMTTVMFTGSFAVVRMDMLMTLFIVLSLYTFFRIYKGVNSKADIYLLPIYIFLAVFTKGAVGFLTPLLSIAVFLAVKKKIKTFGSYLGWRQWAILLGLFAAWFTGVYIDGGSEYLNNLVFKQTVGRGVNSFHHKEPIWFYFPRMLWSFAPWILLYIAIIWTGIRNKLIKTDLQMFFAIIFLANLIMLSLVSAKLDIYLLPLYPFIVYLCSSLMSAVKNNIKIKIGMYFAALIFASLLPGFIFFGQYIPFEIKGILPYLATGSVSALSIMALWQTYKNRIDNAIVCLGFGMFLLFFFGSFVIPQVNEHIGYKKLAEKAKSISKEKQIENYYYVDFRGAENMDVFLDQQLESINSAAKLDSTDRLQQYSILFIETEDISDDKEIEKILNAEPNKWEIGAFSIFILGGSK
ncbi:MAG: ArnT family glycosyltransferase [Bacteroidales bacterium]